MPSIESDCRGSWVSNPVTCCRCAIASVSARPAPSATRNAPPSTCTQLFDLGFDIEVQPYLDLKPSNSSSKIHTPGSHLKTPNPSPFTLHPSPQTLNPKPCTPVCVSWRYALEAPRAVPTAAPQPGTTPPYFSTLCSVPGVRYRVPGIGYRGDRAPHIGSIGHRVALHCTSAPGIGYRGHST
eukprot:1397059-Rhodomonas_salina.2